MLINIECSFIREIINYAFYSIDEIGDIGYLKEQKPSVFADGFCFYVCRKLEI